MPRRMTGAGLFTLLALVLLAPGVALAAAEAPATMIQLPPTMTPDEVKQLVGELVAKGATIAPPPAAAAPASQGSLVWRIIDRMMKAAPEAGRFLDLPRLWDAAVAQEGQASGSAFWPLLAGLIAAALAVEALIRTGLPTLVPSLKVKPGMTLFHAFARHALTLAL